MSADDRCPPWIRLSTDHHTSVGGRYILGGRSSKEFADYGRYMVLMQLAARTPTGVIDVADARRLKSLASDLGMTTGACRTWLDMLATSGEIDAECLEAGKVFIADVHEHVQSYQTQVRVNKRNASNPRRKRNGQPRDNGSHCESVSESVSDSHSETPSQPSNMN